MISKELSSHLSIFDKDIMERVASQTFFYSETVCRSCYSFADFRRVGKDACRVQIPVVGGFGARKVPPSPW
jgi:hypothetical protein